MVNEAENITNNINFINKNMTVVITGGNRGVGKEASLIMARQGVKVIMACRNQEVAMETAKEIIRSTGNQNVLVKKLDLTSLKSVRDLVQDILSTESRLDALICNAGTHFPEMALTEDGVERSFAANYLGHFLLINLLLPLLKKSAPSRISITISMAYLLGHVDFENLNSERSFGTLNAYSNAKLGCLILARELSRRLKGTGVVANAYNPGTLQTDIYEALPYWFATMQRLWPPMWSTVEQSGSDTAKIATSVKFAETNGALFSKNCYILSITPQADDQKVARKLWEVSEKMAGIV